MPQLNDNPPPPTRFLTLLVEGDAVVGEGVRQRVQVDRQAIALVVEKQKSHETENDDVSARRAAFGTFLAICEAQLVPPAGHKLPSLTVDAIQLLVYDADASDFIPLLSVEHLLEHDRVKLHVVKSPSRPGSALKRTSSSRGPRSESANGGATDAAAAPPPRPPSAAAEASSPSRPAPADAHAIVVCAAAVLRAAASNPYDVDADFVREAFADAHAAAGFYGDAAADAVEAGGLAAVGELLATAFALGRASREPNPLQAELDATHMQVKGLEMQLMEQQHILELLQSALLDARLVIESFSSGSAPQSPAKGTPAASTLAAAAPVPSEAPIVLVAHENTTAPRAPDTSATAAASAPPPEVDDGLPDCTAPDLVAAIRRVAIFYQGRCSKDVPDGACAVYSESAGKRSRMITLNVGETISLALVQSEAQSAFGDGYAPRSDPTVSPRPEPLVAGYLRRSDAAAAPRHFTSDSKLHAYLLRQMEQCREPSATFVPVVQVFPGSIFAPQSAAHHRASARQPSLATMGRQQTDGDRRLNIASPTDEASAAIVHQHLDAATMASPFIRPQSALGFSGDAAPSGVVTPCGDDTSAPAVAHAPEESPVRPPRPPSTQPAAPPSARTPQRTNSAASGRPTSAGVQHLPLGVRPVSVMASKVALDDESISDAYSTVQQLEGQPSADGMVDVDAVLVYLEHNYFSLGDRYRFIRILPDRCQVGRVPPGEASPGRAAWSCRPMSARRRQDEAALPASRLTFDEFAFMMLRVAKS